MSRFYLDGFIRNIPVHLFLCIHTIRLMLSTRLLKLGALDLSPWKFPRKPNKKTTVGTNHPFNRCELLVLGIQKSTSTRCVFSSMHWSSLVCFFVRALHWGKFWDLTPQVTPKKKKTSLTIGRLFLRKKILGSNLPPTLRGLQCWYLKPHDPLKEAGKKGSFPGCTLPWEKSVGGFCWWTKSCTSWYGKYPIIYRVSYIPGGAGFLPSTVFSRCFASNRVLVLGKNNNLVAFSTKHQPALREPSESYVALWTFKVLKWCSLESLNDFCVWKSENTQMLWKKPLKLHSCMYTNWFIPGSRDPQFIHIVHWIQGIQKYTK